jgi:hypothetical protein
LRFILSRAALPESAERVALSLADPETGPFLVVTREGRFVTCLGEGMLVQNLPVVTRAQIDSIAAKHQELARHMQMYRTLSGAKSKSGGLILRIYEAGNELSREEITGLLAIAPLLSGQFMRLEVEMVQLLNDIRVDLLRVLKRTEHLRPSYRPLLLSYWKTFYAVTHLAVLSAVGGRELLEKGRPDPAKLGTFFSTAPVVQGVGVSALRGIWAAARMGKLMLPIYKQAYDGVEDSYHVIEYVAVLVALGMRHARLRAEVRKTLSSLPPIARENSALGEEMRGLIQVLMQNADTLFEHPEIGPEYQRKMGAWMAVRRTKGLPEGSAFRFTQEADVPEDLALTVAANNVEDVFTEVVSIRNMFYILPWLSKAQAEDLYLPADFLKAVHSPWKPEQTLWLLRGHRHMDARPVTPSGPTRNGPCPCGSGKKYKRCCGQNAP